MVTSSDKRIPPNTNAKAPAQTTPSKDARKEQARTMSYDEGSLLFQPPAPDPMRRSSIPESPRAPTEKPQALSIPPYHVILEQLAHRFAYHSPDLSSPSDLAGVPQAEKAQREREMLKTIGYEKRDVIANNATGFQATLFMPIVEMRGGKKDPTKIGLPAGVELRPVVAFRGTADIQGAIDDANPKGIGAFQWSSHTNQVKGMLSVAQAYGLGPADVTGHSLGGALAQRCALTHGSMVNNVVTFQSPGIGDDAQKVDPRQHKSTHYVMTGDIVSQAGGRRTSGEVVTLSDRAGDGMGNHTKFPLAAYNAPRADGKRVPGIQADPQLTNTLSNQVRHQHTDQADMTNSRVGLEVARKNPGTAVAAATSLIPVVGVMAAPLGTTVYGVHTLASKDQQLAMKITPTLESMAFTSVHAGDTRVKYEQRAFEFLQKEGLLGPKASNPELGRHLLQVGLNRYDEVHRQKHGVDPRTINRPIERPSPTARPNVSPTLIEPARR